MVISLVIGVTAGYVPLAWAVQRCIECYVALCCECDMNGLTRFLHDLRDPKWMGASATQIV